MLDYLKEDGYIIIHEFNPKALRIKCLFLFERCCFEKIKPIDPIQLKAMCVKQNLHMTFLHLGRWDYVCKIQCK